MNQNHAIFCDFIYSFNLQQQARRVSIDIKDGELKTVLDNLFGGQPFTYTILGHFTSHRGNSRLYLNKVEPAGANRGNLPAPAAARFAV